MIHAVLTPLCDHVYECRVFGPGESYGDPFGASCNVVRLGTTALVSMFAIGRRDWQRNNAAMVAIYRAIRDACRAAGFEVGDFDRKAGGKAGRHRVGERGTP